MAAGAGPFCAVDQPPTPPTSPSLCASAPERIRAFCRRTGQEAPDEKGALLRCILEGIALKYLALLLLERLGGDAGPRVEADRIVGAGSTAERCCASPASATRRVVVTGPAEATAAGNVLVQAVAVGHLGSLSEARAIVRGSFEVVTFEPGRQDAWDEAYGRLKELPA